MGVTLMYVHKQVYQIFTQGNKAGAGLEECRRQELELKHITVLVG